MAALEALLLSSLLAAPPQDPKPMAAEPPRIEWQRNLADALAIQQATGLPLLIAVNMDGERFNELFATATYKDPAFIASTRGYVCVVASPDRHTERDYDALGNRVECPRFPGCTCNEHIAIEPLLFARWFQDKRNAPRHLGVGKDGKVLFDRFLDASMQTAIDAIAQHKGDATKQPAPSTNLDELFARRDGLARRSIESMWRNGDTGQKRKVLEAAVHAKNQPTDLLRAAVREPDGALCALGAMALAKHGGSDAVIDLEDALARIADPKIEKLLVERLLELGKGDPAAARLGSHFAPADAPPKAGKPWSNPWSAPSWNADDRASVEAELDRCEAALRKNARDDNARLAFAVAQIALADILIRDGGKGPEMWFGDALATAKKVRDPELHAEAEGAIAYAAWMTGDYDAAGKAMVQSMSMVNSPRQPSASLAARVLEVLVSGTANTVYAQSQDGVERSQRAEIDRVVAMMDLLRERKVAREPALLAGIGLLEFGGLRAQARIRLEDAIVRFPASPKVHERWRNRLLVDFGCEGVRKAYAGHVRDAADKPTAEWFAGLAALTAGDQHTRDHRLAEAIAAYAEAIELCARSAAGNADYADTANNLAVLALGGRAEAAATTGNLEAAVADLLRANELRPESLDVTDGLQRKPRAIAGRVAEALDKAGKTELAAKLKALLP